MRPLETGESCDPNSFDDSGDIGSPIHLEEFDALGIDPSKSTSAKPGTEEKVKMLSARYAAGLALWHTRDRHSHGPNERDLRGVADALHPPLPLPESDAQQLED